jgi:DNA-binding transcriptional LysR family regulator
MQLQQLYYFKETAERGSINKAAEALLMTQPNLSRSLQKLEEELGLKLFSRDNKGIQLTEEGQQLYQHTCGVLERLEIIKRMSREEIPRMLSVSAFPTLTSTRMLQELYKWYREKSIQFTFRERRLSEIIEDVHQLRSEVGVIHINPIQQSQVNCLLRNKQLEFHPVDTDIWHVYLGPNSPLYEREAVSIEDVFKYTVLRYPDDDFSILTSHAMVNGESLRKRTKRVMLFNNEGAIISLLRTTDAVMFGMRWNRELYSELGIACKPILDYRMEITVGWVKRQKAPLSPEAERFISVLKRHYGGQIK